MAIVIFSVYHLDDRAQAMKDEEIEKLHQKRPQYRFNAHRGAATEDHKNAIVLYGLCPEHRLPARQWYKQYLAKTRKH